MKKQSKLILKYLPSFAALFITALMGLITIKTFTWIKQYGDFATTSFVLEAKADCINKSENDLHRHEDWESKQLKDLNDKIDKIYFILIDKK